MIKKTNYVHMKQTCKSTYTQGNEKEMACQAHHDSAFCIKQIILFIFAIYFISCSQKGKDNLIVTEKAKTVSSKLYNAEIMAKYVDKFEVIDSAFYLFCAGLDTEAIVLNEENGEMIGSFGIRGNGPGEFMNHIYAGRSQEGDTIYTYDLNRYSINVYLINKTSQHFAYSFIDKKELPSKDWVFNKLLRLKNGMYVGLPFFSSTSDNTLVLFDEELNFITDFAKSPITFKESNDFRVCYDNAYLCTYENKVFLATSSFVYISGYEISGNGEIAILFEKQLVESVYHYNPGVKFSKEENLSGFSDIKATKDYIFTLFCGKPESMLKWDGSGMEPESFVIFNHKGEYKAKYKTNNKGGRICFSEDEKKLYHSVNVPEYDIEEYQISDMEEW
ncbi:hypothetical protein FACS189426_23190 [Bacteroidia bacterium]|nr:hypothetical protein FACS189426_23190 [Bacteroidia bacterium]